MWHEHVGQYFYIVDLSALFLCNHFTRPLLELTSMLLMFLPKKQSFEPGLVQHLLLGDFL